MKTTKHERKCMRRALFIILIFIGLVMMLVGCEKDEMLEPEEKPVVVIDDTTREPETLEPTSFLGIRLAEYESNYDMVEVSEDGTFEIDGVTHNLFSYLAGGKLKSTINKTFFKIFIHGSMNESLNLLMTHFPGTTPQNSTSASETIDTTILFEEMNYIFGDPLNPDTIKVDSLPGWVSLLNSVHVTETFKINNNEIIVDYADINYRFNMEILKVESSERFIEAIVDNKDTVLFFNAERYFKKEFGSYVIGINSLKSVYGLADTLGYYDNTLNHITDSTLANYCTFGDPKDSIK